MVVAACRIVLYLEEGRSLKEKRRLVKGLLDRLRERHNVSASEVGDQDLWQKAALGLALAAPDQREAEARMGRVLADLESLSGLKHIEREPEYYAVG